jgi:hypothetical protein
VDCTNLLVSRLSPLDMGSEVVPMSDKVVVRYQSIQRFPNNVDVYRLLGYTESENKNHNIQ